MTAVCTNSITTDSITGMIFAAEGIRGTVTLLNGPMGCKFYHSTTSQFLMDRPPLFLPAGPGGEKVPVSYQFYDSWFFRQPQVPCTWLDGEDYIYGTADQVRDALQYLRGNLDFSLLVIVNAPGASLIGDSLEELAAEILPEQRTVVLESPGYSENFCDGYSLAVEEICRQGFLEDWKEQSIEGRYSRKPESDVMQKREAGGRRPSVNLLGLSVWQRYFEGDREELIRLLNVMGIDVNCTLAAGCSTEEIRRLPEADLNIVLFPERGRAAAELLQRELQMPYLIRERLPVGFSATEDFCREIAGRLGVSADRVLEESRQARARAFSRIRPIHEISGLPEGILFSIEGSSSEVYSYSDFLQEYLGMLPDVLAVTEGEPSAADPAPCHAGAGVSGESRSLGVPEGTAPGRTMEMTEAELVFGNANTIALLKTREKAFCGIEISNPGMGYTDLVTKTHMGIRGALFLTEQVINGLMSRL